MSISSEISRISGNVSASLAAVANKGVTVPAGSNSDDLASLIAQIQTGGGPGAISVVDTPDSHGGYVRTITAVDISDTTAVAADVVSGKYFYTANGTKTAGTATIGVDCPTFSVVTNNDFSSLTSITCDKTFAECLAYWQNDQRGAIVSITRGTDTYESAATAVAGISNAAVVYVLADNLPVSHLTIYYTSNGSIEYELDPYPPHDDSDLVVSGATVNVPAGVFLYDAAATVASGTAGTPVATKGSVSNHSVSITPSVTNTTGYITGGTQTGAAVTVSASELVSGSETKTQNGTYDVTNLAQLVVNVPNNIVVADVANTTGTTAVITGDQADLITKTITLNGTYSATDDNADGYSAVTVNVQNGASTSNVQNNYGTEVVVTSAPGVGPSATQHTIYFEFTDETNETVYAYYDDTFVGDAITATTPATKGQKTVTLAQLDGVTWYSYSPSQETWETLFNDNAAPNADSPYNYLWISSLSDLYPVVGEVYRVTVNGTEYRCTAYLHTSLNYVCFGNPKYSGGTDDGSDAPFNFYNAGWGALVGDTELAAATNYAIKIERLVTED